MSLSFKQYHAIQTVDLEQATPDQLNEIFGFSADEKIASWTKAIDAARRNPRDLKMQKAAQAARAGLKDMAEKDKNMKAIAAVKKAATDDEKYAGAVAKQREAEKQKMAHAQAVAQAADQGSSKAWRDEAGSIKRGPKGSGGLDASDYNAKGHFAWKRDEYRR